MATMREAGRDPGLQRWLGAAGAALAASGIALSAYAAHATLDDGVRGHLQQAALFALVQGAVTTALAPLPARNSQRHALALQLTGALVFSGSVALHALAGVPALLAPAGGIAMIAGWLWMAVLRARS